MSTVQATDTLLVQRGTTQYSTAADLASAQDTDLLLINRAGVDYQCSFLDLSTKAQDTDLLLVNRAGVDYKCSFLDWKNSQKKAPTITSVTLADSPEAGRFTSGTFRSTVVADDGKPAASKGIKAWVEGTLKASIHTDVITAVGVGPDYSTGRAAHSSRTGTVTTGGGVAFDGSTTTFFMGTGSAAVDGSARWNIAGLGLKGKLEVYAKGASLKAGSFYVHLTSIGWIEILADASTFSEIVVTGGVATGHSGGFSAFRLNGGILVDHATLLTFATDKDLAKFAGDDAVAEITAAGAADDATGTVSVVDVTAKTISLSATHGTWDIGNTVKGPLKTAANAKLYCKLNAGLTVTDLQSADPGYTAVTGAGPYTVTFPAALPTGAAPDADLPAGTTITTELQAVNSSGTVTKTSNTVTPT